MATLFICYHAAAIAYCDKDRTVNGDYKLVARLSYSTLQLDVAAPRSALLPEIRAHAEIIQAKRGQALQVSTCGQTVLLGA